MASLLHNAGVLENAAGVELEMSELGQVVARQQTPPPLMEMSTFTTSPGGPTCSSTPIKPPLPPRNPLRCLPNCCLPKASSPGSPKIVNDLVKLKENRGKMRMSDLLKVSFL